MKNNTILTYFCPPEMNTPVIPCGNDILFATFAPLPIYEPLKFKYGMQIIESSFFTNEELVLFLKKINVSIFIYFLAANSEV